MYKQTKDKFLGGFIMASINNEILIGGNHIVYNDISLNVSNICRTFIFRFQNREKERYEKEKAQYNKDKIIYEADAQQKRKKNLIIMMIIAISALFISIIMFSNDVASGGIFMLFAAFLFSGLAYYFYKKDTSYPILPPEIRPFPDKYGLGIELNSGYTSVFTAIGDSGIAELRKLQKEINEADTQSGTQIFNLNDHSITIENKDGIISTGDNSNNVSDHSMSIENKNGIINTGDNSNNVSDHSVSIENKDGIINTGDNSNNLNNKPERTNTAI